MVEGEVAIGKVRASWMGNGRGVVGDGDAVETKE